ncbi:4-hydroxybenzoate polyprenyltransferase, partial [Halorubrum pallidum]
MASKTNDPAAHANDIASRRDEVLSSIASATSRIKDVLTYSSAYLVFIAMVEVLTVHVVLSLPLNPAPVVVGLVTFSVYAGDRVADADSDALSTPERSAFVTRHREAL